MRTEKVKIKDLEVGNHVLDRHDKEVIVTDIGPFDDTELMVYVKGIADGILRIGSSPKEAVIRRVIE